MRRSYGLGFVVFGVVAAQFACDNARIGKQRPPLVIYAAGSLARPLRALLDSFAVTAGEVYQLETAGSLELARRVTELGRTPDVIALADEDVFPQLLVPTYVDTYTVFARNRMVLALSARRAGDITATNWVERFLSTPLEIGRPDPQLDPAGYRTIFVFQLIARARGDSALAARLLGAAAERHVRPKSADLVALLQASELDAAFMYESSARAARLPFVELGAEFDLSDPTRAAEYARASLRVPGARRGDTITVTGAPIQYAIAVLKQSTERARGERLLAFLQSATGRSLLKSEYLDVVDRVVPKSVQKP